MLKWMAALVLMSSVSFAETNLTKDQTRLVPHIVPNTNGKVDGFFIEQLDPGNDLALKMKLRLHDIVKSIDGEPMNSPTHAMDLYNKLQSGDFKKIVVIRDGKMQTLTFDEKKE